MQVFNYTCIFAVSIVIGIYETSYYTGRDVFPGKAYPFLFPIFLAITANAAEQSISIKSQYIKFAIESLYQICYNNLVSRETTKMYDVIFYSDSKGNEPVAKYINGLRQKSHTNKTARITGLSSYITSSKNTKDPSARD